MIFLFLLFHFSAQFSFDCRAKGNAYLFDAIDKKYNTFSQKNRFFFKSLLRPSGLCFMTLTGLSFWQYAKKSNVKKFSLNKENSCAFLCSSFLFANYLKAMALNTFESRYNKSNFFFLISTCPDFIIKDKYELDFVNCFLKKEQKELECWNYDKFFNSENPELVFGALMNRGFSFLQFVDCLDFENDKSRHKSIEVLKKFIYYQFPEEIYRDFFETGIFMINVCCNDRIVKNRLRVLILSAIMYTKKNLAFNFIEFKNLLFRSSFFIDNNFALLIFKNLGTNLFNYKFFKDFVVCFFIHYKELEKDKFNELFLNMIKNIDKNDMEYIYRESSSRLEELVVQLSDEDKDKDKLSGYIKEIKEEKEKYFKNFIKKLAKICEEKNFHALFSLFQPEEAMKNLGEHIMCPLKECNGNNQGCAYLRVKNKIDTHKTPTEKKFKIIASFIDELVLLLDKFVCLDIQLTSGSNIFGVVESEIILKLNENEYILVHYDALQDAVIFRSGREISTKEIDKIKSDDTKWY